MTNVFHSAWEWYASHGPEANLVLFVLALLGSAYPSVIRRAVSWPSSYNRKAVAEDKVIRDNICKRVHANPYELILFLADSLVMLALMCLVVGGLTYAIVHDIMHRNTSFSALTLGLLTGGLVRLAGTLRAIRMYKP